MGRHTLPGPSNGTVNERTNPKQKWVRMLHVLDYHRWHHVKKLVPNKKHNNGRNVNGIDATEPDACEPYSRAKKTNMENPQIQQQITDSNHSIESCPPDFGQQRGGSSALPSSPPTKSSRAKRIKKMIMKEVSKRRGKHRRSLTCPVGSQITEVDGSHHQQKATDRRGHSESIHNDEIPIKSSVKGGTEKCELCSRREIECHLGNKMHVIDQGEQELDQINTLFQGIPDEEINQLPYNKNVLGRSVSFQHSKEFLDALDVLSVNKQFFLRILDDPGPSLRQHFLNQQAATVACTKRKALTKSETFPSSQPSSSGCPSPNLFSQKQKAFSKEDSFKQAKNDGGVVGKKFKDLGQKIKHLIRESRKERRRIAMDAVLHKVPYGKKVSEESIRESPRISSSENDVSFSPNRTKDGNDYKRQSPSLDQSIDRYRHLLLSTSFNRADPKLRSPERSRLRVTEENSSKHARKDLRRILSSPDLHGALGRQYDDHSGHNSSRIPNRRVTSFNEHKAQDVSTMDLKMENIDELEACNGEQEKQKIKEDMPSNDDTRNNIEGQNDKGIADKNELVASNNSVGATTSEDIIESNLPTDPLVHEKKSEGSEPAQGFSDDSPAFACAKLDNEGAESPLDLLSYSPRQLQVDRKDEAEFNFVKDILKLSGYSGNQLLGTWNLSEQPVDPSVFVELESCSLLEPECSPTKEGSPSNHLLLFDLINEVLLKIYERSVSYWPTPLSTSSRTHPMPKGYRVLEEVWACINWYMGCSKPEAEQPSEYITTRDLSKDDGWMNLQSDAECVALEVEGMIFQDLLTEIVS